jgi:hypothetical protein
MQIKAYTREYGITACHAESIRDITGITGLSLPGKMEPAGQGLETRTSLLMYLEIRYFLSAQKKDIFSITPPGDPLQRRGPGQALQSFLYHATCIGIINSWAPSINGVRQSTYIRR